MVYKPRVGTEYRVRYSRSSRAAVADGSYGVRRANAQQPKLFVGMILILIFAEALALYGLIGAMWSPCSLLPPA